MANKNDIIFKFGDYEIYKKGAGENGTFPISDCLTLVRELLDEMGQWENAGFKYKKDLIRVFDGHKRIMQNIIDSHNGK